MFKFIHLCIYNTYIFFLKHVLYTIINFNEKSKLNCFIKCSKLIIQFCTKDRRVKVEPLNNCCNAIFTLAKANIMSSSNIHLFVN